MKVIVVGVPGAGKTSVSKGLEAYGWTVVTFGTFMFEMAKKEYGITHRDHMRIKIKADDYKKLQEKAAKEIAKLKGKIVIDTHLSIKKPEGYYPGLPENVLKKLQPDAMILVEADGKEIDLRREKDAGERIRSGDSTEHQQVNRYFAAACSVISCIPVSFINNKQGKLNETVEKIADFLKKVGEDG